MFASVIGLISSIDELIIYQDTREEQFSLHYLEDILTRFLFLPLSFLLEDLGLYAQPVGPTYVSHTIL